MELLIQMGMDIFKAVDTCYQIGLQKDDTSLHPCHYSMSVSAATAPCSRSCPSFTFSWDTVNSTTAGPWKGRLRECRQSVPFYLSVHCREGAKGGCGTGAELSLEFAAMQPIQTWGNVLAVRRLQNLNLVPWGLFFSKDLMTGRDGSEYSWQESQHSLVSEMANCTAKIGGTKGSYIKHPALGQLPPTAL